MRVTRSEIEAWRDQLSEQLVEREAVRLLLDQLIPEAENLHLRRLSKELTVVQRHNIGGRLFIVRDGEFEAETRGAPNVNDGKGIGRRSWKFRENDVFGELEVEHDAKWRDRRYFASVMVRGEGPLGHAEVLEIPADVTSRLMQRGFVLSNPFFNLLGRRVLDGLIRYDRSLVQEPLNKQKAFRRVLECYDTPDDHLDLAAIDLVAVASLLLQCVEYDSERGGIGDSRGKLVVMVNWKNSISEVIGRQINNRKEASNYNRALRFLASAGVIRYMRPVLNESNTGEQSPGCAVYLPELKAMLQKQSWFAKCNAAQNEAYKRLISQTACYVLVADELALRRCVREPSLWLIKDFARRRKIFFPQPPDVESARDTDLSRAIQQWIRDRFTSDHWRSDSFGRPTGREAD